MKTTLLIDINDTLDDEENSQYNEEEYSKSLELPTPFTWVLWPRKWIEDFSDFLIEYKHKILPIFWTRVGLYGQNFVANTFLKTEVTWFDWKNFHKLGTDKLFSSSTPGIADKSYYFPLLFEYIKWKSERIIWFEDHLNQQDQDFVDSHQMVDYIWIDQNQTLTEKIPEIIKLIK